MDKSNILNYLKEHYLEFQKKYNIEQIGLFGSYARDESTLSSDIDIYVKMPPKLFYMVAIKDELEKVFHKNVDIVRLRDKMNPYLQKRILKDGINTV